MRERPILFSGPLVRAILDGRKTVTRRVVTPSLLDFQPGDRLYVREAWRVCAARVGEPVPVEYRADGATIEHPWPEAGKVKICAPDKWRPGIHLPKWGSRIWLDVLEVRDEPLQDITELDALAEGVEGKEIEGVLNGVPGTYIDGSARDEFARLWDSINAPRGFGWADNPTVRRIEFRPLAAEAAA